MKARTIAFTDWQERDGVTYAVSEKTYAVTIDLDLRLKRLIKSCRFRKTLRGLNGSFLRDEEALPFQAIYSLLRFQRPIGGKKVKAFFANMRRTPATLREVLCFFLSLPSLGPLEYDVIALRSRWYDKEEKQVRTPFIDIHWRVRLTGAKVGHYTDQDVFLLREVSEQT